MSSSNDKDGRDWEEKAPWPSSAPRHGYNRPLKTRLPLSWRCRASLLHQPGENIPQAPLLWDWMPGRFAIRASPTDSSASWWVAPLPPCPGRPIPSLPRATYAASVATGRIKDRVSLEKSQSGRLLTVHPRMGMPLVAPGLTWGDRGLRDYCRPIGSVARFERSPWWDRTSLCVTRRVREKPGPNFIPELCNEPPCR